MYRPFAEGHTQTSSVVAYLPDAQPPSFATLAQGFARLGIAAEAVSVQTLPNGSDVIRVEIDGVGQVTIRPTLPPKIDNHVRETMRFDAATTEAIDGAPSALSVELKYTAMPIADLHDQVRFAAGLAPNLLALLDVSAQKMRGADWVLAVANAKVPPPPTALFTIHALPQTTGWWLHTHGLQRCAGLELELHDVPEPELNRAAGLLNMVAPAVVERRWGPGEPFAASERVSLCWVPWQDPRSGAPVASGRTPLHQGPAGVLVTADGFRPAYEVLDAYTASKTYTGSNMGKVRDGLLAQDTLERFVSLHRQHAHAGWQFEVKLAATDARTEFMWFRFESLQEGHVEGTLLNQPLHSPGLKLGDRVKRPVADLADWAIAAPGGVVRPATLDDFEKRRAESAPK